MEMAMMSVNYGFRESLLQMHEGEGSWAAHTRLAELSDVDLDHTWLRAAQPASCPTLEPEGYVDSVRLWLGCAGPTEPVAFWTRALLATCCAVGDATRGHNAVTAPIHAAAQSCDHTFEMEVPGLIPGTDLRPADVLTSALTPRLASQSAHRTPSKQAQVAPRPGGPHLSLLRHNISYTRSCEVHMDDPTMTR